MPRHATPSSIMAATWAALAGALALFAVACAPEQPGRGERLARISMVLGGIGLALEVLFSLANEAPTPGDDVRCVLAIAGGAILPAVLLTVGLKLSGAPVRRAHALAVGVAGALSASAAVWVHCPGTAVGHVLGAHVALPIGLVLAVGLLVAAIGRPRPLSTTVTGQ